MVAWPDQILRWNRDVSRRVALEIALFVCAVVALAATVGAARRRVFEGRDGLASVADAAWLGALLVALASGIAVALAYRWAAAWSTVTVTPYVRSLVCLAPDVEPLEAMPYLVRLHIFSSFVVIALLAFTRPFADVLHFGRATGRRVVAPVGRAVLRQSAPVWSLLIRRSRRLSGRRTTTECEALGSRSQLVGSIVTCTTLGALAVRAVARVGINQGYSPAQPIEFSHRLHAGESHIPCLYCHYAATRSQHAGIPRVQRLHELPRTADPADGGNSRSCASRCCSSGRSAGSRCTTCPDFVHFDHSQHVRASVACQSCHGPVERMVRVAAADAAHDGLVSELPRGPRRWRSRASGPIA